MITAQAGLPFTADLKNAPGGLVGELTVAIKDTFGIVVTAATTAGIFEIAPGNYSAHLTAPATVGDYYVVFAHNTEVMEALSVVASFTPIEVVDRLRVLVNADEVPVLETEDLEQLLYQARMKDSTGRVPTDTAWVPTYDVNLAASEGWRLKAGKVAHVYSFSAAGKQLNREQMVDNFLKMSKQYASKTLYALSLKRGDKPFTRPGYTYLDDPGTTFHGPIPGVPSNWD